MPLDRWRKEREGPQGEPIQQPRDYEIVDLDYKITDASYRELLVEISRKRLQAAGCAKSNLIDLLASPERYSPHTEGDILDAVAQELSSRGIERSQLTNAQWTEYVHRLDEAMVYRVGLKRHSRQPRTLRDLTIS